MREHASEKPGQPGRVKEITSAANPIIKEIRGLALKKNRDASGLFMSEGLKLVADAIESGWTIRTLVHAKSANANRLQAELVAKCKARGADILEVSEKVLAAISKRDNPQTVIGIFEQKWLDLETLASFGGGSGDVLVALDRIRDPGNLGTIIRTCDAVGGKGVILIGDTTDPFSLEAARASMGSIFHVPLSRVSESEFLYWRNSFSGRVIGTHLEGSEDYRGVNWNNAVNLLLMGNEQQGLTHELARCCDQLVIIPMAGKADSLNLAIATGVVLFEARRGALNLASHSAHNRF